MWACRTLDSVPRAIDNYQEQLWCSQELESKDSFTRLNIVVKNLMLPRDCYAPLSGVTATPR